jgi:hypothetical protein
VIEFTPPVGENAGNPFSGLAMDYLSISMPFTNGPADIAVSRFPGGKKSVKLVLRPNFPGC